MGLGLSVKLIQQQQQKKNLQHEDEFEREVAIK